MSKEKPAEENQTAKNSESAAKTEPPTTPGQSPVIGLETIPNQTATVPIKRDANEEAYQKQQITLSERQTVAAEKLYYVTAWATVVGAFGMLVLFGTLIIARQSTNTAARELELSERPWVSVGPMSVSDLTYDKDGAHLKMWFSLTNTGHSPAAHVELKAGMTLVKHEDSDLISKAQENFCADSTVQSEYAPFTLFPGGKATKTRDLFVSLHDVRDNEMPATPGGGAYIIPIIVGCALYRYTFSPRSLHQTSFIYSLYSIDPAYPGTQFWISPNVNITANKLGAESWPFSDPATD